MNRIKYNNFILSVFILLLFCILFSFINIKSFSTNSTNVGKDTKNQSSSSAPIPTEKQRLQSTKNQNASKKIEDSSDLNKGAQNSTSSSVEGDIQKKEQSKLDDIKSNSSKGNKHTKKETTKKVEQPSSYPFNSEESTEQDSSFEESLPQVVSAEITPKNDNGSFIMGLVAWALVGIGVVVVLIVILSNRGGGSGGHGGKKRYKSKRGKHRLLKDKYYRNLRRK